MGLHPKHLLGTRSGPVGAQPCANRVHWAPTGRIPGWPGRAGSLLARVSRTGQICPLGAHHFGVTTALVIGLVLAAWLVLPFPLAVLSGRWMRAGGVVVPAVVAPGEVPAPI